MKFYQAEMEAFDFMKGYHTLKEWANYGFNKVVYDGHEYWDGLRNDNDGQHRITDEDDKKAGLLAWDIYDYDDDGFMYVVLRQVKE